MFDKLAKDIFLKPEKSVMMRLLLSLSLFLLTCGNPGQDGNNFLVGDVGGTEVPSEFLSQVCGGSSAYHYKFRINSIATGGRLIGELEEGQYQGRTLRKFIGKRDGAVLYIEEKGEEQFNVVISVCRRINDPHNFRIDAVGLSTKTTRCPPYEDINYATVTFSREGSDYDGNARTVRTEFYFSAFQCY